MADQGTLSFNLEKPKKKVNSKAKGGGFESKVAKLLEGALAPLKFRKSQSSGAIVGGMNAKTAEKYSKLVLALYTGDVVPTNEREDGNPSFKFVVECKFYKEAERMESLLSGKSNIYKWLQEAVVDAKKVDKRGILICKWNNTPMYAVVQEDVKLPTGVSSITILDGVQVCYLEELLKHREFWIDEL